MTHRGRALFMAGILAVATLPASAQSAAPSDDRLSQLEQKLQTLLDQAAQLKQEIQQLRGNALAPAAAEPPVEDLTAIDVATPPATSTASPTATASGTPGAEPGSLTDVATVENPTSAGAAKALNPDMSAIANFVSHGGDNPDHLAPADLQEVELALEAFIDPYAKGKFFIGIGKEGIDVEEGYAQFVTLPYGLTAKAGKTKAAFGKANTWHTHVRPWIDQPLMISRFFGEEGLADSGISVSKTIDNPFNTFLEGTGEVYAGDVENVFGRRSDNDLFYNAHLKAFRDITENSNLEAGASWAQGTLSQDVSDVAGHNRFTGVDLTYRWKPLSRSIYQSFVARFEGLANRRADFDGSLYGFYASADYQLGQRWFTGVRVDRADVLDGLDRSTDRGVSATLTFWPSEFSQLRGQLRHTKLGLGPSFNEVLLQLQFAIGAHGAHTF